MTAARSLEKISGRLLLIESARSSSPTGITAEVTAAAIQTTTAEIWAPDIQVTVSNIKAATAPVIITEIIS